MKINLWTRNHSPWIKAVSTVDGLTLIPDCIPKSSKKYIPKWWKTLAYNSGLTTLDSNASPNVKACPSFIDYFSKGIVLPMWVDSILYFNSETNTWRWKVADEQFPIQVHSNDQYLNFVPHKFLGKESYFIFKLVAPWKFFTPKGYSLMQLPMTYHFNEDFSVLSGVIDTDTYHEVNPQVVIHSDKKEIFIPRGTPLVQLIPYKRTEEKLEVLEYSDAPKTYRKKINKQYLNFSTVFLNSNKYNEDRKHADE